ncbi:hypothetical protein LDENG_00041320 [Lucifuga dentata]|nr:hypothetical protein LDENG_00041320 [Lucifuga dentata]
MQLLSVLILLLPAALLCAPAPPLDPVTCTGSNATAARLAMHRINENHQHGYKFKLIEVQSSKVEEVDGGCNFVLQLDLRETNCHVLNPKHFEDCEIRGMDETEVMAKCSAEVAVTAEDAFVSKYDCKTQRVHTDMELAAQCPDCPKLLPLNNTEGLNSVDKAITNFNQNTSNQNYYVLQEVARLKIGYMMMAGMMYYADFVVVETNCPMGSRIALKACKPLCSDRARHAYCHSSYSSSRGITSLQCEFYPALKPVVPSQEPTCVVRPAVGAPPLPVDPCLKSRTEPGVHPICSWPPLPPVEAVPKS